MLAPVAVEGQDAGDLVEIAAAWSRVVSWATARRADALAEIVDASEGWSGTWSDGFAALSTEVAMRECISRQAASSAVKTAVMLSGPLQATGEALREGAIDAGKANLIARTLADLPIDLAQAVEDDVLPEAGSRTPSQLGRALNKARITADPETAEAWAKAASVTRRVCHPKVLPDGMASIYAVMPAADAIAIDLALDAAARAAKAGGDARTMDQLRADVLASVGSDALRDGFIGSRTAPTSCSQRTGAGDRQRGPSSASSAGGAGGAGGAGKWVPAPPPYDPGPTSASDDAVPQVLDPPEPPEPPEPPDAPELREPSEPPDAPELREPSEPPEPPPWLDHGPESLVWLDPGSAALGPDIGPPPPDDPSDDPPDDTGPSGRAPGFILARQRSVPVRVHVTVPLSTLMGGDEPGHLDGYGSIDAMTARALAMGGTWRRLVTDPLTGTVLDVGRSRYRPPADLAELVRLRDETCFRPGCSASATGCELDHTTPWAHLGTTSWDNLGAGCTADHSLKTEGHFTVRQHRPGVFTWTSTLTGISYRRELDGSTTQIGRTQPPAERPPRDARDL